MRRSSLLSSPQVHRTTSYIQTRLLIPYDLFAFGKSREQNFIVHLIFQFLWFCSRTKPKTVLHKRTLIPTLTITPKLFITLTQACTPAGRPRALRARSKGVTSYSVCQPEPFYRFTTYQDARRVRPRKPYRLAVLLEVIFFL